MTVRYTMARIGIFIGCLVAIAALVRFGVVPSFAGDANVMWVLGLAIVVSAPISFVVLRKHREEMSVKLTDRVAGARLKWNENRTMEDGE